MLIVCCGNLRSGSTLQYRIAAELAAMSGAGAPLGYGLWGTFDEIAKRAAASTVIVKEHSWSTRAREFDWDHTRLLYSYRDIRDVVVSLSRLWPHLGLDEPFELWSGRVARHVSEIIDNHDKWTRCPNVYVARYESFRSDIASEVRRLSEFLHMPAMALSGADVRRISDALSVESQKAFIDTFDFDACGEGPVFDRWDPMTQLHRRHFNGGESGRWKHALPEDRLRVIERIAGTWLVEHGYALSGLNTGQAE
jgi:hypothetical protein